MKNKITKLIVGLVGVLMAAPALAEEGVAAMATGDSSKGLIALAAGLAIGIAALGGTLGQSKIGGAAMDGMARNPSAKDAMFVPMILGLVFIESLVLFTFAISFLLLGKV